MVFPAVTSLNLLEEACVFPDAFAGNFNMLFITTDERHLNPIHNWVTYLAQLDAEPIFLQSFILPIVPIAHRIARNVINNGMKASLPDWIQPQFIVPLYLDRNKFSQDVGINDLSKMNMLLVDKDGQILWQTSEPPSQYKISQIRKFMQMDG